MFALLKEAWNSRRIEAYKTREAKAKFADSLLVLAGVFFAAGMLAIFNLLLAYDDLQPYWFLASKFHWSLLAFVVALLLGMVFRHKGCRMYDEIYEEPMSIGENK